MHLKNENSHHRRECCHAQGETVVDASEKGFFIMMMMDVDMTIIINMMMTMIKHNKTGKLIMDVVSVGGRSPTTAIRKTFVKKISSVAKS